MRIEREAQKANNSGPQGRTQANRVPTYEGSMLGSPSRAMHKKGGNIIK